ncbi:glycoside hydrolase family 5 protein [Sphingomonas parva]|uniref:Glycoside hydrolase family 5 protein n=1 Tax=Sphingomonas parva TaxID=2555898 RepID=A0A4Y8ZSH9_9SPHN|nr:glycoside hydrolase family 5 protein [Sphingomonas parva]TFI58963.1 glycoside hydrolase family 5 protein [Sphingomonas parva]
MIRLLAGLCLFLAAAAPAAAETPVERHGQLRVEGNRIVDARGEPVVLRGMSLFWSQWAPQFYNRGAVAWLRDDWKADVVRAAIAVHSGGYMEHPDRETKKAEAVIDAAIASGLYVIVDWHAHQPEPEAAAHFFSHIARKYGHLPNIIYETWNEPLDTQDWSRVIKPYHLAVIPKIREADPDNLIVAGTQTWSQDVDKAAVDPLPFTNLAYTLHFYAGTHRQSLRDKADDALAKGAALFVTEWGTTPASGDGPVDVEETRKWWDFLEANKLSYLNWSITTKRESSAALLPGADARGGWKENDLTPSGRLVREHLRAMHDRDSSPPQPRTPMPCGGTC